MHTRSVSRGRPRPLPCPLRPAPPLLLLSHSRRARGGRLPLQRRCPHGPLPGQLGPWRRQPHGPSLVLARGRSQAACHGLQLQVGHTHASAPCAPAWPAPGWQRPPGCGPAPPSSQMGCEAYCALVSAAGTTLPHQLQTGAAEDSGTQAAQAALSLSSQLARMLRADGSTSRRRASGRHHGAPVSSGAALWPRRAAAPG